MAVFHIKIIKDFLTGRKGKFDQQQTNEPFPITTGCPQGSLLSPFSGTSWSTTHHIFIHIKSHLPAESKLWTDLSLCVWHIDNASTQRQNHAVRLLQQLIDLIKSRLEMLKQRVNAAKTVLIIFSRKRTSIDCLQLTIDGLQIKPTTQTKLLGLTLDSGARASRAHLNNKDRQNRKIFFTIRSYVGKNWGLSGFRLKAMYKALVEPTPLYWCSVWASAITKKQSQKKLRSIERQFNILISKSFKTADFGALSYK